jgi:hypothetical protein
MNSGDIRKTYTDLKNKNELILAGLKKQQLLISLLRLLVFIAGGILSVLCFSLSVAAGIPTLLLTIFLFLLLVKRFTICSDKITIAENLIRINNNELNALDGDYSAFEGGNEWIDAKHDFSSDIDLFGEDSVFRYLNRTVTGPGRSLLASWLAEPFDLSGAIPERQEAVSELAGKLGWRQQFTAYGLDKPLNEKEIKSLNAWLNGEDNFFSSPVMRSTAFILPVAGIIFVMLVIAGILPVIVFLLLYCFNLLLIGVLLTRINRIHEMVSRKHVFLSSIEQLVKSFEKEQFNSSVLITIQEKIFTKQGSVADKIRKLDKLIQAFDSRLNLFVGFIMNGLLLWDFHCIMRLEKWRKSAASNLPVWLNLLGEIDGFNSLANYSYNNPDNSFPTVTDCGPVIEAFRMGHPLLNVEIRVDNDFSVERRGKLYIITGANMAGKSTFLRTVAVNMVLAMTGAPVCAGKMRFSPVKLFTSMRTTDSLSHNESYFYAELKRLKTLKERLEKGDNIFFILDEILKGTNSTDKSLGSKLFLRRLIELGGTGLIATHDISLGEMEKEFHGNVVNKCFEIEIDGENINFDYILRDGITRKMNAAVLMKQMGIV